MRWLKEQKLLMRIAAHVGRGEHAAVIELAEIALKAQPDDTTMMTLLAASCDRLGEYDRAVGVRERLLKVRPDDRTALYLTGRYYEQRASTDLAMSYYSRYLDSAEKTYPVAEGDYRFLRFLARIFGSSPRAIEENARTTSQRLDREEEERRRHAAAFIVANTRDNRADA